MKENKFGFIDPSFRRFIQKLETPEKVSKKINLSYRSSIIPKKAVGHIFYIHNGKTFLPVFINEEIINHKLGEFSQTRKTYLYKKGKVKQKTKK